MAQSAYPPGFAYSSQQYRVVFGAGSAARLNEEVERLGIRQVLVLTTREQTHLRCTDPTAPLRDSTLGPHR